MFRFVAVVVIFSTSRLGFKDLECDGEVRGDAEGDLLSEWYLDMDLLAIRSLGPSF